MQFPDRPAAQNATVVTSAAIAVTASSVGNEIPEQQVSDFAHAHSARSAGSWSGTWIMNEHPVTRMAIAVPRTRPVSYASSILSVTLANGDRAVATSRRDSRHVQKDVIGRLNTSTQLSLVG